MLKVSDLFRRSKQLADLEGSDFITWNEAENCINESFIGLYEKLINMGDNSFVESFRTKEREIDLPKDFWQLKGVFLWNNGNLQTINRRADNNGTHHLSYEMRNGKVYIFGNPNDVLIEYYKKPKVLTMPPSDREISLDLPEGAEVLDCCGHTFLYVTQDAQSNDILCIYDLDGIKNAMGILSSWTEGKTFITKDCVFTLTENGLDVYHIAMGNTSSLGLGYIPLVAENGDLYLVKDNKIYDYGGKELGDFTEVADAYYYVANNYYKDIYALVSGDGVTTVYHNGTDTEQQAYRIIYADEKCYFLAWGKFGVIENDEVKTISMGIGNGIGFVSINKNTGYGYATYKFNKYWVCAYCEDTELNFPNSFYFQMLSYLLAISFRCKQGADISLLSSQLDMISQTFEDTLGSDNFQYPRMGNVYN